MTRLWSSLINKLSFAEDRPDDGPLDEPRLRQWLIERLARQLKIATADVDTARSFESYGLDSIVAVQVTGDLEKLIEKRLSPAILFEHRNIDDLARFLANELALTEA